MKTMVQARLDEETQAALERLVRRRGWSASRAVREGLQLLVRQEGAPKPMEIVGLGQFDSGFTDLGSNKKHLQALGMNSGIDPRLGVERIRPKRKRR
ncbi:MAG: hypothetical protein ACRD3N_15120 [Terracidiphilus sp.]